MAVPGSRRRVLLRVDGRSPGVGRGSVSAMPSSRRSVPLAALLVVTAACAAGQTDEPRADEPRATVIDGDGSRLPVIADLDDRPEVPPLHPSVDDYPEALVELRGERTTEILAVKLADDEDLQAHGLMEVEVLPEGTGMLFVFDQDRVGGFWMRDTLVALDIAFVAADGEILDVMAMDPCTSEPCAVHDPGVPYRSALEVPQGFFERIGIRAGDRLAWVPLTPDR